MTSAATRRPAVLLLDDEAQLTTVMTRMLENEFDIEVAANVEEATMLLGTREFDAIIADHMMPGQKQGLDFLVEAIRLRPAAKRILMTGYMNPELLARAVTLGQLSALLLKPATAQQIRKALHDALGLSA
jgi:DNA-binding NtrC family response regulator